MMVIRLCLSRLLIGVIISYNICPNLAQENGEQYQYGGPELCINTESLMGYTNLTKLHNDMLFEANDTYTSGVYRDEYLYTLCPYTIFDLGMNLNENDAQFQLPIVPYISNTTVRCGEDGNLEDRCVIYGGFQQIVFHEALATVNVVFAGIMMAKTQFASVLGWGHPMSEALFIDCHWEENNGHVIVDIFYRPPSRERNLITENLPVKGSHENFSLDILVKNNFQVHNQHQNKPSSSEQLNERIKSFFSSPLDTASFFSNLFSSNFQKSEVIENNRNLQNIYPGMYIGFFDSYFIDNELLYFGIRNVGGKVQINRCEISDNEVGVATIANIFKGRLALIQSVMNKNVDKLGPIFVDEHSYLVLNQESVGNDNSGHPACVEEAIFLEDKGSKCLSRDGDPCTGSCCSFGDESCDKYVEPDVENEGKEGVSAKNAASSEDTSGDGSSKSLIALAVIVPLCVIFSMIAFWIVRKKRSAEAEMLTNDGFEVEMRMPGSVT